MEGHCSTGQSPQWTVVPVEEEEEEEEAEEEEEEAVVVVVVVVLVVIIEEEEEEEEEWAIIAWPVTPGDLPEYFAICVECV